MLHNIIDVWCRSSRQGGEKKTHASPKLLSLQWLRCLWQESILPTQLRTCLAELHPETGSHMIFEQPQEIHVSLAWAPRTVGGNLWSLLSGVSVFFWHFDGPLVAYTDYLRYPNPNCFVWMIQSRYLASSWWGFVGSLVEGRCWVRDVWWYV